MRLTYITHDEVNANRAHQLASKAGVELIVNDVRQRPMTSWIVCDLDFLPIEFADWLLRRAERGHDLSRVAVHTYHMTHARASALRAAGVVVCRRLNGRMFRRAVEQVRTV